MQELHLSPQQGDSEKVLEHGDKLRLGDVTMVFIEPDGDELNFTQRPTEDEVDGGNGGKGGGGGGGGGAGDGERDRQRITSLEEENKRCVNTNSGTVKVVPCGVECSWFLPDLLFVRRQPLVGTGFG